MRQTIRAYRRYIAKVIHDYGTIKISVIAQNRQDAINIICQAENCPVCAIDSIKDVRDISRDKS